MTTLEQTRVGPDRIAEKIKKVQELYADAPEVGRIALKNGLEALKHELAAATGRESAGRIGARQGHVSELTAIVPLAPGGGKRIRGLLDLLEGNFKGADLVGTLHDMRFVLLDNDTKLLFATTYDGEWDAYIDDFATKIPDFLDIIDSASSFGIRLLPLASWASSSFTWPQRCIWVMIQTANDCHGNGSKSIRVGSRFTLPRPSA